MFLDSIRKVFELLHPHKKATIRVRERFKLDQECDGINSLLSEKLKLKLLNLKLYYELGK